MKSLKNNIVTIVVSALGTLLAALLVKVLLESKTEYRIDATSSCIDFRFPEEIVERFSYYNKTSWVDDFSRSVEPLIKKGEIVSLLTLAKEMKESLKSPTDELRHAGISQYCQFQFSNTGEKELSDLQLQVGANGFYFESGKIKKFQDFIVVGSLRPKQSMQFYTLTDFISPFAKFNLSTKDTNFEVERMQFVSSSWADFIKNWHIKLFGYLTVVFGVILSLLSCYWVYLKYQDSKSGIASEKSGSDPKVKS